MPKDLPTVDIKGHSYVMVKDRVLYFNATYPKGSIKTELLSPIDSQTVIIKAYVYPDESARAFIAHSQAVIGDGYINKTAALENAETSAVGRALAMMGIGVIESIASADEINKAIQVERPKKQWGKPAIDKYATIKGMLKELGKDPRTLGEASNICEELTDCPLEEKNIAEIEDKLRIIMSEKEPKL